ncbi:MAG: right-handed parallel beta-helix repeat-containing protein [Planctomycetota bacterium]
MGTPWKTIGRAAAAMGPGETCMIRQGTYREAVVPKTGQTFRGYKDEQVVVSGCNVVAPSKWTPSGGDIYRASVNEPVYDVFVGGRYMDKARWPDADSDVMRKNEWVPTTNGGKRDAGWVDFDQKLPADFVGGFYTGHNGTNPFNFNHGRITSQSDNRIAVSHLNFRWWQGVPGHIGPGTGNIIDHLNCLTTEKEWHWQDGTLYLYPPGGGNPNAMRVEARVRLYGFDCSGKDAVQIQGLNFVGASLLMDGSNDCVVDGCTFKYVSPWGKHYYSLGPTGGQSDVNHYTVGGPIDGTAGLYFKGNNNTLKNSVVMHGWGCLVTLLGSHSTVENNYIGDANWITRQHTANITVSGKNQKILNNTLRYSTGRMIAFILYDGSPVKAITIRGNDCRRYAYAMFDGGTSCFYTNGENDLGGAEISYNVIADNMTTDDRVSCGIYLDDGAHNATIHHNVIHGGDHCRSGIFTHRGDKQIWVYHNSVWNVTRSAWLSSVWKGSRDTATMVYRNNHSGGLGYSQNGVTGSITQDHNRDDVPAVELADVQKIDFRIQQAGSASIDAGTEIRGINDQYFGDAPDLGAFEFGGTDWKAGATVEPSRTE